MAEEPPKCLLCGKPLKKFRVSAFIGKDTNPKSLIGTAYRGGVVREIKITNNVTQGGPVVGFRVRIWRGLYGSDGCGFFCSKDHAWVWAIQTATHMQEQSP